MYTLEQNETTFKTKDILIISGKGSNLNKTKGLNRKIKNKSFTKKLIPILVNTAKENEDEDMIKSYWNTYHCQEKLIISNGRSYGKYCGNRFCLICCNNRKAEIINKYYPIIKNWSEPHSVTLTVKACHIDKLESYFKIIKKTFSLITSKYRKQELRATGKRLIGIKSLECHYNPLKDTYQPHMHLIVANKEMADNIVKEWLTRIKESLINKKAQKVIKILKTKQDLINAIKYACKIFKEKELKTFTNKSFFNAHHNIIKAMKNLRIFDRFGFDLPKKNTKELSSTQILQDGEKWEFSNELSDWVSATTCITLSKHLLQFYTKFT